MIQIKFECTDRNGRWRTSVLLIVKVGSDLSDGLSMCAVAAGDNGASNCSQVERCYLHAYEVGSKNFISIEIHPHLCPVSFTCLFLCGCIYVAQRKERKVMGKYTLFIMGSFCVALNSDRDVDRNCQLQNIVLYGATTDGQW